MKKEKLIDYFSSAKARNKKFFYNDSSDCECD